MERNVLANTVAPGWGTIGHKMGTYLSRGRRRKYLECELVRMVEYGPEKAGVGGSTPSLATKPHTFNSLPLILNPTHRVDIS